MPPPPLPARGPHRPPAAFTDRLPTFEGVAFAQTEAEGAAGCAPVAPTAVGVCRLSVCLSHHTSVGKAFVRGSVTAELAVGS